MAGRPASAIRSGSHRAADRQESVRPARPAIMSVGSGLTMHDVCRRLRRAPPSTAAPLATATTSTSGPLATCSTRSARALFIGLQQQQPGAAADRRTRANLDQKFFQRFRRLNRLGQNAVSAQLHAALRLIDRRDDVDRNVPQGQIVLQAIEHAPAVDIRQRNIEQNRLRLKFAGQGDAGRAQRRDQAFEAHLVGGFQDEVRKSRCRYRRSAPRDRRAAMVLRSSFASSAQRQRFAAVFDATSSANRFRRTIVAARSGSWRCTIGRRTIFCGTKLCGR